MPLAVILTGFGCVAAIAFAGEPDAAEAWSTRSSGEANACRDVSPRSTRNPPSTTFGRL